MTVADYMNSLIRAVIHDDIPPEKPEGFSFEDLFILSNKHKLENICLAGVQKLQMQPDAETIQKWMVKNNQNVAQEMVQESEKKNLAHAFRKAKILYLPMKGWYLRGMYPRVDYRFMSDIDILINRSDREKAYRVMHKLGYTGGHGDYGSDDSYKKGRFLHVELHYDMINMMLEDWYYYYQDIWDKAFVADGYECRLDWNDYYIYMCVNFAKDYKAKGTGTRSALDFYMFRRKYGDELNYNYIYRELDRLNIREIEAGIVKIAENWFGYDSTQQPDEQMSSKLIRSGIFGSTKGNVQRRFELMTDGVKTARLKKVVFVLQRAFPGLKIMRYKYPLLNRMPLLLPFFWVFRWKKHYRRLAYELDVMQKLK